MRKFGWMIDGCLLLFHTKTNETIRADILHIMNVCMYVYRSRAGIKQAIFIPKSGSQGIYIKCERLVNRNYYFLPNFKKGRQSMFG